MKISSRLDRATPYILIFPAVLFIFLFSILPIAGSMRYAFYDLQLNDRSRNAIYTEESVNLPLNEENNRYLLYFMDVEESVAQKPESLEKIEAVRMQVQAFDDYLKQEVTAPAGVQVASVDANTMERIVSMQAGIQASLDELYKIEDSFYSKDDAFAVAADYDKTIITSNFTGADNFTRVLQDPRVRSTMWFTLAFTAFSVFFELILGLALAMVMNRAMKGRGLIRTVSLIPWAIPTSVAALIWSYLYNGSSGIMAHLFSAMQLIESPARLLTTSGGAFWGIVFADVWKTTPYMALLLLAGLQTIPEELYESSSLEGAKRWQQFRHITLPLLKPSIFVALLFRTLDAFRVFDLIYVLTGGGPGGSTESISIYAYKIMFAQTRFGYGSAVVLVMALVVGIITLIYIKALNVKLVGSEDSA